MVVLLNERRDSLVSDDPRLLASVQLLEPLDAHVGIHRGLPQFVSGHNVFFVHDTHVDVGPSIIRAVEEWRYSDRNPVNQNSERNRSPYGRIVPSRLPPCSPAARRDGGTRPRPARSSSTSPDSDPRLRF